METTFWMWICFALVVMGLLALDLGILHRETRAIDVSDALRTSALYIILALLFAGGIF